VSGWKLLQVACLFSIFGIGCAPVEYTVVISQASKAIAEAETAGASCTQEQLDSLSPVTKNQAPDPGTELVSSEEEEARPEFGEPTCDAPYEYYSAVEYRQKAREEVGYSDYDAAIEYAREARVMAQKARDIALNRDAERGR
jgi:hypothetical protein